MALKEWSQVILSELLSELQLLVLGLLWVLLRLLGRRLREKLENPALDAEEIENLFLNKNMKKHIKEEEEKKEKERLENIINYVENQKKDVKKSITQEKQDNPI